MCLIACCTKPCCVGPKSNLASICEGAPPTTALRALPRRPTHTRYTGAHLAHSRRYALAYQRTTGCVYSAMPRAVGGAGRAMGHTGMDGGNKAHSGPGNGLAGALSQAV